MIILFYIGKALQAMGLLVVIYALIAHFTDMGPLMKWAGLGVVEFYIGYGLTILSGKKDE